MKENVMGWSTQAMLVFTCERRDDRRLIVTCHALSGVIGWAAVAADTPGSAVGNPTAVLDDHAHKDLGKFRTLGEMKEAVERFAKKWQRSKFLADKCACEDINVGDASLGLIEPGAKSA